MCSFPFLPSPNNSASPPSWPRADRLRRLRRYALELSDGYLQAVFVEMFGTPLFFDQVTIESVASDQ